MGDTTARRLGRAGTLRQRMNISDHGISDLQQRYQTGDATTVSVGTAHLERIRTIDPAGPRLNAIAELNSDALNAAFGG